LGALPGVIGTLQAMEALKILTGHGTSLAGRMLHYDATYARMREIALRSDPSCALCGEAATITEPVDYEKRGASGSSLKEISVETGRELLQKGFDGILLDVREKDEHAWAHLEGCRLAPLSEFMSHLDDLPRDRPYLVYCKMGQRSSHAAAMMVEAGFPDVTNLQGGIVAWLEANGPVVQG
jgi:adenylyltransferase/sulfurtransferase